MLLLLRFLLDFDLDLDRDPDLLRFLRLRLFDLCFLRFEELPFRLLDLFFLRLLSSLGLESEDSLDSSSEEEEDEEEDSSLE